MMPVRACHRRKQILLSSQLNILLRISKFTAFRVPERMPLGMKWAGTFPKESPSSCGGHPGRSVCLSRLAQDRLFWWVRSFCCWTRSLDIPSTAAQIYTHRCPCGCEGSRRPHRVAGLSAVFNARGPWTTKLYWLPQSKNVAPQGFPSRKVRSLAPAEVL